MAKKSEKPGKVWFYFFGLPLVGFGLLFLLISFIPLFIPMPPQPNPQMPMTNFVGLSIFMSLLSISAITLGVGTLLVKRWARKIMLILSGFGLFAGSVAILFFILFAGTFFSNIPNPTGSLTPNAISGIKITLLVVSSVFYVVLPGISLLFYRSGYVLKAVEYYDPKETWMDACPTPVFAVSLFSILGVLYIGLFLTMFSSFPFTIFPFPFWVIALIAFALGAALIYISFGFYNLEIAAWWTALILVIAGSAFACFLFRSFDPLSMYQQMHVPEAQLETIKKSGMLESFKSMSNLGWITLIPYLGYLWFIRRYFLKKA